MISKRHS